MYIYGLILIFKIIHNKYTKNENAKNSKSEATAVMMAATKSLNLRTSRKAEDFVPFVTQKEQQQQNDGSLRGIPQTAITP